MSEIVHYKGKIKLVPKIELDTKSHIYETLKQQCERICKELGYEKLSKWTNNYKELLLDKFYGLYIIINDCDLYKVVDKNDVLDEDIYIVKYNGDNTYDYEVVYYNGCTTFNEAIQEAFDTN